MIVNSFYDISVFLWCLGCGLATGILFDFFRALRKNTSPGIAVISFQDALFCAGAFYLFTQTIDKTNNGDLRWYEFAGLLLGLAFYFLQISRFALGFMSKILYGIGLAVKKISSIAKRISGIAFKPFTRAFEGLKALLGRFWCGFRLFYIKKVSKKE